MKMNKLSAVAMVALLGSLSVNATFVVHDPFEGGEGVGLNNNIHIRQAGSPEANWTSYTLSGTGTIGANVTDVGAPFGTVMWATLTGPAGGHHNQVHLNTDYATQVGGQEWKLSYDEYVQADAGWGGWAGIFVGEGLGFGAEFGLILRPDGAYSVFNGFTEIANGEAGSLVGEDALYSMRLTFNEVEDTVTITQDATLVGTYAVALTGTQRHVMFRTHYDGGSATSVDTFRDNLTIEVLSSVLLPDIGDITVEQLPGTNGLAVTWPTEAGSGYALQIKASLLDEGWTNHMEGIVGTGGNLTVTTAVDLAESFYRVTMEDYIHAPDGKEYLVFELTNVPLWDFDRAVGELVADLGANNPASGRMYAFGMNAVPLLTRSVSVLNGYVNSVFDVAEAHGVPAYFHIDPMYAFGSESGIPAGEEPSLQYWDHPDMCEWVNFPGTGETNGQIPRVWINWGSWLRIGQALPNYESPAMQQFYKSQLEDGILKPIKERLLALQNEGKGYLFAGLNIGWETHLQDRSDQAGESITAANTGEPMYAWEQAKTGYAALYTKGWDDASLTAEASVQGISKDRLFYDLCAESVQSNMMLLAKTASDYGFFKSQVFSHIVALESYYNDAQIDNNVEIPPVWTALNDYCTPGFTLDEHGAAKYDLTEMENTFDAYGHPFKYAAIESYLVHYQTEAEYTAQLNEFFTDVDLVAVYGAVTNVSGNVSAYTMNAAQAAAISNWLSTP